MQFCSAGAGPPPLALPPPLPAIANDESLHSDSPSPLFIAPFLQPNPPTFSFRHATPALFPASLCCVACLFPFGASSFFCWCIAIVVSPAFPLPPPSAAATVRVAHSSDLGVVCVGGVGRCSSCTFCWPARVSRMSFHIRNFLFFCWDTTFTIKREKKEEEEEEEEEATTKDYRSTT